MTDFNTLRIDLTRRLLLCGAWDGKLYWYKDTIQLLKKMMQFVPPKTNADRIRSMTDEELAEWASIREMCFIYHLLINDPDLRNKCQIYESCKDCWLEWLNEESEDE